MQVGTYIALVDMNSIRVCIDQLEIKIESMVQVADYALGNEDAVNLAIDEIKNKIETFAEIIESLSVQADTCSRQTMKARTVVVQKIIKYSS
jgi:hypothetical protein